MADRKGSAKDVRDVMARVAAAEIASKAVDTFDFEDLAGDTGKAAVVDNTGKAAVVGNTGRACAVDYDWELLANVADDKPRRVPHYD